MSHELPDPEQAFRQAVAFAESLQGEGRWEEAAHAFARAGALALEHDAVQPARMAWGAAGEAFRRADRVVEARDALQVALAQPGMPDDERAVFEVRLSGCLTELGNGSAALQILERTRGATAAGSPVRVLVVDALVGTLLGWGAVSAAEALLPELESNDWAHDLRTGQILRLAGRLDDADQRFELVEAALDGLDGAESGLGAVRGERAEIAALRGRAADSAEVWARAVDDHADAGRTSLMWRAEAGRVRCLVQAGLMPFPNRLDEGLGWAADRSLATLEVDLGLALGIARSDGLRLAQVRDRADSLGLNRRAGRAELARATMLEGAERLAPLQRALDLLVGDVPHQLRARVAHAEALTGVARGAGVTAARTWLPHVQEAGMTPEVRRLEALLEE